MKSITLLLSLVCCLFITMSSQAQTYWSSSSTNDNDIYNTNSGNIGIGTSSPAYKLDLNGMLRTNGLMINVGTPAAGHILTSSNSSGTVQWTSVLPVANGGTGFTSISSGDLLVGTISLSGASIGKLPIGTTGQVLTVSSSGFPSWTTLSGGSSQWTTSGNNIYNNNTGYVGIGNSSPATKLDVIGNLTLSKDGSTWGLPSITLNNGPVAAYGGVDMSTAGLQLYTTSNHPVHLVTNSTVRAALFPNGNFRLSHIYYVDDGNRLQVDGPAHVSGNMGIGTASPTHKLHVNGDIRLESALYLNDANGQDGNKWGMYGWDNLFHITRRNSDWSYGVSALLINTNGDVGIGVNPEAKFHVAGSVKIVDGTQGAGKVLTSDANGVASWQTPSGGGGGSSLWTAGTNAIYNTTQTDKVGIGTGSTAPAGKLEVKTATGSSDHGIVVSTPGTATGLLLQPITGSDPYSPLIKFKENLTGTTALIGMDYGGEFRLAAPSNKLISFGSFYSALSNVSINSYVYGVLAAPDNYVMKIRNPDATAVSVMIKAHASQTANLQEWQNGSGATISVVNKDGNMGIGVATVPATYKLAVGGNVIAEKVKVKLQSAGWPDYVFYNDYQLPSLKEVEQFIKKHNHLPGVPSATEIEKSGLDLGDGQAVLLKKVEELTLYVIELNKKVEALTAENEKIKKEMKDK